MCGKTRNSPATSHTVQCGKYEILLPQFYNKNSLDAGIQDESTSISIVVKVDL